MTQKTKIKTYKLDMTTGSILAKLVRFSVPLVLSSLLQLLFNAADIAVVGRFAGDNSLAAVGSTSSLINLMVNLFVGLSIGANVVAANFFGANKFDELKNTIHTAMLLSIFSGIILTILGVFGAKHILYLMKAPTEVLNLAALYLQIYFAGITATMIYNFGSALLRAKGDTKRPMYYLMFSGVVNVILNLIFVIIFKMDVAGVALATVISQCISAILVVHCLMHETAEFRLEIKKLSIDQAILYRIIKIGVPAGIQGIVFSLSNVVIQSAINSFGSVSIAGNSAALNIEGFVYTSMNGFSQGTLTFVSQNLGAAKYNRIKQSVFTSLGCVLAIGLVLGNAIAIFGHTLLGIYSSSAEVIEIGIKRLWVIGTTYALCGMMDVTASAIRGLGKSMQPMIITLIGACGIRLLWLATIFQIPKFHSLMGIYISYPISWAVTLSALLIAFTKTVLKEIPAQKEIQSANVTNP